MRRAAAVFGVALFLYSSCCAWTVQGGDAGEFMVLAVRGGVAHPPGYPLFVGALRLFGALPLESAAFKASLTAATFASLALALLSDAVRRLTDKPVAGYAAAVALGLSPTFWRYATVAEVFSAGAFTAMLVVWVAVRIHRGWRGRGATLALGLAVATGIANHHTVVLLAPLALHAGFKALDRPLVDIPACLGGLACGFAAYLPLAIPGGAWRWGQTTDLEGLAHHFLRRDYGTFDLALSDVELPWTAHPLHFLERLPSELFGVWLLLAVVGCVAAIRAWRGFGLALLATVMTAGPLFLAKFNVPAEGLGLVVAHRFAILPIALLCVFAGVGFATVHRRWMGWLLLPLGFVQAHVNKDVGNHANWTVLEDYLLNTLSVLEPNAVVIVASDNLFFGGLYAQEVMGVRPDVVLLHPRMMGYPWYRDSLHQAHPDFLPVHEASIPEIVAANIDVRPVYLSREHLGRPALAGRLPPAYPESGVLMRVSLGPLPPPVEVEAQMVQAMEGFVYRSRPSSDAQWHDTWESWAFGEYAGSWNTLALAFEATGDAQGASRCRMRASSFEPPP